MVDEFSKRKYIDKLDRLYIRIACRTAISSQFLEEEVKKLWEGDSATFELAPLRCVDVENAASAEGIDPDNFLSTVRDKTLLGQSPPHEAMLLKFRRLHKHHGRQHSISQPTQNHCS